MKQPEALRLADSLDNYAESHNCNEEAAAELRRLHTENQELLTELQAIANANPRNWDAPYNDTATFQAWAQSRARAAIAKATGKTA